MVSSVMHIYTNAPGNNSAYIPPCISCIDTVNNLRHIFEFVDNIMCPNGIDIYRQYEFGMDYVNEIMNYFTQCIWKKKTGI